MNVEPVIQGASFVLLGNFNPAIFHPAWFAAHNLIRQKEADAASVQVIVPQAAVFSAEWLSIHVVQDRFQASTTQELYYEALRDLVLGVFELLNHTPLTALGMNRDFRYELGSEEAWHKVGHTLAPKHPWNGILDKPGMLSLSMEGKRPDGLTGYIKVKVEASAPTRYGVYIEINDHYLLATDNKNFLGTSEMKDIVASHWQESMERSLKIAKSVVSLGGLRG